MNIQQAVALQEIQAPLPPPAQKPTGAATAKEICAAVDRHLTATIGQTGASWGAEWLSSRRFYLIKAPLTALATPQTALDPARLMATKGYIQAAAEVPVIVDLNRHGIGRTRTGFSPKVIVLAGQHNHQLALKEGRTVIAAWVGELACRAMGIEIQADHQFGARELEQKLMKALRGRYATPTVASTLEPVSYPYIQEVYPLENYFIFTLGDKTYKQRYTADMDRREVTLSGEPREVTQKFVAVKAAADGHTLSPIEAAAFKQGVDVSQPVGCRAVTIHGEESKKKAGMAKQSWHVHPKHAGFVHAALRRMGFRASQSTTIHSEEREGNTQTRQFVHAAGYSAATNHGAGGFQVRMQAPAEVQAQFVASMNKHLGIRDVKATGTSEGACKAHETKGHNVGPGCGGGSSDAGERVNDTHRLPRGKDWRQWASRTLRKLGYKAAGVQDRGVGTLATQTVTFKHPDGFTALIHIDPARGNHVRIDGPEDHHADFSSELDDRRGRFKGVKANYEAPTTGYVGYKAGTKDLSERTKGAPGSEMRRKMKAAGTSEGACERHRRMGHKTGPGCGGPGGSEHKVVGRVISDLKTRDASQVADAMRGFGMSKLADAFDANDVDEFTVFREIRAWLKTQPRLAHRYLEYLGGSGYAGYDDATEEMQQKTRGAKGSVMDRRLKRAKTREEQTGVNPSGKRRFVSPEEQTDGVQSAGTSEGVRKSWEVRKRGARRVRRAGKTKFEKYTGRTQSGERIIQRGNVSAPARFFSPAERRHVNAENEPIVIRAGRRYRLHTMNVKKAWAACQKDMKAGRFKPTADMQAKAPAGWEGTVKHMKKEPGISNPWALAHWMKNEGYEPHK